MASTIARRAAHTVHLRTLSTRYIQTTAAPRGWLGSLLHGSQGADPTTVPQTTTQKQAETAKPMDEVTPSLNKDATVKLTSATELPEVSAPTTDAKKQSKRKRRRLSPEEKTQRYQDTAAFIMPRLGRQPQLKLPKIRKTTWIRLLGVCQTEEELRKVVDLFPRWRDMDIKFDASFSETFIRRCLHLKAPQIALDVFGNYAKYSVPMTLVGARELLNATYDTEPLSSIITITSLFDVYKLPPVAQDLPCCAMVITACFKDGSADALVVGKALLLHLKKILDKAEPQPIPKTQEKGDDMPRVWASWALRKVDRLLFKARGKREEWLRDWRLRSGHISEAGQI